MTCEQIQELLSDLIDDELADGARAAVQSHLAVCEACAAEHRALLRTVRFVRANKSAALRPGTPGGVYMDFTRALADEAYERSGTDVIVEAVFGRPPQR
jgi:anti-sigma factor RsiW